MDYNNIDPIAGLSVLQTLGDVGRKQRILNDTKRIYKETKKMNEQFEYVEGLIKSMDGMNFLELEGLFKFMTSSVEQLERDKKNIDFFKESKEKANNVELSNMVDDQLKRLNTITGDDSLEGLEKYIADFSEYYDRLFNIYLTLDKKLKERFDTDEYRNRDILDMRVEAVEVLQKKPIDELEELDRIKLDIYLNPLDLSYVKNRIETAVVNKKTKKEYDTSKKDDTYVCSFTQAIQQSQAFEKFNDNLANICAEGIGVLSFILGKTIEKKKVNNVGIVHILVFVQNIEMIDSEKFVSIYGADSVAKYKDDVISLVMSATFE